MTEIKLSYINKNNDSIKITNTIHAFEYFRKLFDKKTIELKEYFYMTCLNRQNKVIGFYKLSEGTTDNCTVDIKHLLACAILSNSSGVIITHNHPSGNLTPSNSDKQITFKIRKALKLIDVILLDHLIITKNNYYSFEQG